jgi:hypothetical protein
MITRVSSDPVIRVLTAARNALLLLAAAAPTPVSAGRRVDIPDDGGQSPAVGLFVSPAPPVPSGQHPEARQAVFRKERARLSSRWQGRSGARRTPR